MCIYRIGMEVYSPGNMQSPDYECGIWVPAFKSEENKANETASTVATMTLTGIL
ncbi:MAG: hypothetical protein ACI4RV_04685 [Eubacteriales bacterium]